MIAKQLRTALAATLLLALLTGLIYPGVITALAQVIFPHQANGSLVRVNGKVVGSALIGQNFTQPYYFHGRPSAAGDGYDAAASSGSNKGPTDRKLADTLIAQGVAQVRRENGVSGRVPADAVTRSGSGLDPHISPAYAELQIARVARARGASEEQVRRLVRAHTEGRQFGFLGDPRVNVLLLNIALDQQLPRHADSTTVSFGGFIDSYYAYQLHRKAPGDIPLLTQPGRHNEFNINLAYIDAKVSGPRVRARLALQAGTSVALNYAGEPRAGLASGPDLQRHIQEAVVGYRLADQLWVDGGIYLSHIGSESWISRDSWTYTRSLVADYSPYYEAGVKLTWSPGQSVTTITVVNGWQNISENNAAKSVGVRVDYAVTPRISVGYSNLIGNEQPDSLPAQTRFFNDFYGKVMVTDKLGLIPTFDFGHQNGMWWGYSLIAHLQTSEHVALAGRIERYADPHRLIVTAADSFVATGFSVGVDVAPAQGFLWRSELRRITATRPVFPADDALHDRLAFLVTSLALTL